MASGVVPRIGTPASASACASFSGRLPAELDDHAQELAPRHLDVADLQHVLDGQRLEVEPVGGVVVGGDRLRVAVDHDRLDPESRMAKAACTQQ
jgi:hypothetical protein